MEEQPRETGVEQQGSAPEQERLAEHDYQHADIHRIADVAVQALDDQSPGRCDGCGGAKADPGEAKEAFDQGEAAEEKEKDAQYPQKR